MPDIHPTAIVTGDVRLADDAVIGPYCVVQATPAGPVTLGPGVVLHAHVSIAGPIEIGANTQVFPGACLGFPPQDYKFKMGDPTAGVAIGSDCIIREHVTVHAATKADKPTRIGNGVFMMVGCHAGHDATVGDRAVMVNACLLAGHSELGERVTFSGGAMLHQFNRVGRLSMVSGLVAVAMDVPPFCLVGARNTVRGLNLVGLRRNGFSSETITAIRAAFREVLRKNLPRKEMISELEARADGYPEIAEIAEFVRTARRPICHFQDTRGEGAAENE